MDTIYALATAPGRAGVAVIRVSGPKARESAASLTRKGLPPREAVLSRLETRSGRLIDTALVLAFPAPHSFTGEDVVEYHLHGSYAVVDLMQRELSSFDEHRMADPGEFTRRALSNGKLDLTQVEGLADIIEAQTSEQLKQAQNTLLGKFSDFVQDIRDSLIRAGALLEATIDFADEEVPEDVTPEVLELLGRCTKLLEDQIAGYQFAERIRQGFEVAIIGAPNVGKSTLLNALAGREAAITSKHAGTTRDVIEVQMDLEGIPVTFLDTAGLRDAEDEIEKEGIERARRRAEDADVRIHLLLSDEDTGIAVRSGDIRVRAKQDIEDKTILGISGKTGAGIARLTNKLVTTLSDRIASAGLATRERHSQDMARCLAYVRKAEELVQTGPEYYDLASEDLRAGRTALGRIIGTIDVENILDVVFSSFCIGK